MIYQVTAPRTMQAFLVVLFSVVVSILVLNGQEVPDLIGWSLAGIIGFYFNTDGKDNPFGNGGGRETTKEQPPLPSFDQIAQTDPASPIVRAGAGRRVVRRRRREQSDAGTARRKSQLLAQK